METAQIVGTARRDVSRKDSEEMELAMGVRAPLPRAALHYLNA